MSRHYDIILQLKICTWLNEIYTHLIFVKDLNGHVY